MVRYIGKEEFMKNRTKKEGETYSFEEYKKRFPPPPPLAEEQPSEDPADLGARLAEESLAS